jgi:hypothetical protein
MIFTAEYNRIAAMQRNKLIYLPYVTVSEYKIELMFPGDEITQKYLMNDIVLNS